MDTSPGGKWLVGKVGPGSPAGPREKGLQALDFTHSCVLVLE